MDASEALGIVALAIGLVSLWLLRPDRAARGLMRLRRERKHAMIATRAAESAPLPAALTAGKLAA